MDLTKFKQTVKNTGPEGGILCSFFKNPYLPKVNAIKVFFPALFMVMVMVQAVSGQTVVQPKQLEYSSAGILYEEERAIELRPHSNGGAIGVHFGKSTAYY